MMKDFAGMMKQVQEMQENVKRAQAEIAEMRVAGQSGGGLVSLELTGQGHLASLNVDDSLLAPGEKEMLEDLIIAAFNDAKVKADTAAQDKMKGVTGGIGDMLPPGMKLPF